MSVNDDVERREFRARPDRVLSRRREWLGALGLSLLAFGAVSVIVLALVVGVGSGADGMLGPLCREVFDALEDWIGDWPATYVLTFLLGLP